MDDQTTRGERFRALHEGEPFVIPNPWDAGSARVLEGLGFAARLDDLAGRVPRPEAVAESLGTVFAVAAPIAAAALLCVLALREVPLRRAA